MANFFQSLKDKAQLLINKQRINASYNTASNEELWYEDNIKVIYRAIYLRKTVEAKMSKEVAARYCVRNYLSIDKEFYVLTELGEPKPQERFAVNICSPEINALIDEYIQQHGDPLNHKAKDYEHIAAEVLAEIDIATKNKTLIGFTNDKALADKYVNSLSEESRLSILTDKEAVDVAYQRIEVRDRPEFLKVVFESSFSPFPSWLDDSWILTELSKYNPPFASLLYKMIVHQIERNERLNLKIYSVIMKNSSLKEEIEVESLKGLDLNDETQVAIIQRFVQIGRIDELKTDDGWLSKEEMAQKYHAYEEEMKRAESELRNTYTTTSASSAYDDSFARQQIEAQKEISRNAIRAQIAALEGQLSATVGPLFGIGETNAERQARERQRIALQIQISALKTQLDKIK